MNTSSFKSELEKTTEYVGSVADPVFLKEDMGFYDEVTANDPAAKALKVGDKIPSFALPNATGQTVNPLTSNKREFLIVLFYRGQWCPFCNLQLRHMNKALNTFEKIPATLVAISPITPDNSLNMVEKNSLEFEVLSDVGNVVSEKFGVKYKIPEYLQEIYLKNELDLEAHNGEGNIAIPLPSVFVTDKEGKVIWRHVGSHPNDRADPEDVIAFLKNKLAQA